MENEEMTNETQTYEFSEQVEILTEIREEVTQHPALTTDFADYTVSECLLLLLFLSVFCSCLVRLVKGGLSWLN